MKKLTALILLLSTFAQAGLPPTTSKVTGDSSDITTFKYQFPNFTGTHTGTSVSLGVNSVAGGGTGDATLAAHGVLLGNGASAVVVSSAGTAAQVLTSNGAAADPTFQAIPGAVANVGPILQSFTSGSGTFNEPYAFIITSGSATAAATYTNNSITYTVMKTVASATLVYMTGSNVPLTSGTLTKASGTGDATLTFTSYKSPLYNVVTCVGSGGGGGSGTGGGTTGGGGGGAGGADIAYDRSPALTYSYSIGAAGTAGSSSAGGAGNTTTFGSTICSATGGSGGAQGTSSSGVAPGGAGGSGATGDVTMLGSPGQPGNTGVTAVISGSGGNGGSSYYSGGGASGSAAGGGGSDGSGGAGGTSANGGGAGGAGALKILSVYQ